MKIQTFDQALDFMPEATRKEPRQVSLLESALALFSSASAATQLARRYEAAVNRGVSPSDAVKDTFRSHYGD